MRGHIAPSFRTGTIINVHRRVGHGDLSSYNCEIDWTNTGHSGHAPPLYYIAPGCFVSHPVQLFSTFFKFFSTGFFRVKFFVYIYYVIKVIDMIHLTNLYSTKYHQKHNEVLLKKLTDAGIMFSEVSRDNSRQIMVHPDEFEVAALVVLGWLSFINN